MRHCSEDSFSGVTTEVTPFAPDKRLNNSTYRNLAEPLIQSCSDSKKLLAPLNQLSECSIESYLKSMPVSVAEGGSTGIDFKFQTYLTEPQGKIKRVLQIS